MRFDKYITWNPNLCVEYTHLVDLFQVFEVCVPSRVIINGHIGLKHRGNYSAWAGWGIRASVRSGPTAAAVTAATGVNVGNPTGFSGANRWIKGCVDAGNIEQTQNYVTANLTGCTELEAGWHRVEFWGKFHTSSSYSPPITPSTPDYPLLSGVEVNGNGGSTDPYNHVSIVLEPL